MKRICFIILFCCAFSCKSQVQDTTDTQQILNVIIPDNKSPVCLFEKSFYNKKPPTFLINHYLKIYRNEDSVKEKSTMYNIFYKDIYGVISVEELNEMKNRYTKWAEINWKYSELNNIQIKIISNIKDCEKAYRILEPLYSADGKKAIVALFYDGGKILKVLEKRSGKWIERGGIPIGTSG